MWMRAHVDALACHEFGGAHLIEEDEGADHLPLGGGQRPAHLESAQIARPRHDDGFDGIHGIPDRDFGVECGVPAHIGLLVGAETNIGGRAAVICCNRQRPVQHGRAADGRSGLRLIRVGFASGLCRDRRAGQERRRNESAPGRRRA